MEAIKFLIVSPHFPPHKGGLSDYCFKLNQNLKRSKVLTKGHGEDVVFFDQWQSGLKIYQALKLFILNHRDASILVQYVPYMYHKRGFAFALMFSLVLLKVFCPPKKVILYIHEFSYPWESSLKSKLLCSLQSLIGAALLFLSDEIVASCLKIKKQAKRWTSKKIKTIPIGPNIEEREEGKATKRLETPYMTIFGGGHVVKRFDLVLEAYIKAKKYETHRLVFVGQTQEALSHQFTEDQLIFIQSDLGKRSLVFTDYLYSEDAVSYLKYSDLNLSYFLDGMTLRRGSVIAPLSMGVPCLSNLSSDTDLELIGLDQLKLLNCDPIIFESELIKFLVDNQYLSMKKSDLSFLTWNSIVGQIERI